MCVTCHGSVNAIYNVRESLDDVRSQGVIPLLRKFPMICRCQRWQRSSAVSLLWPWSKLRSACSSSQTGDHQVIYTRTSLISCSLCLKAITPDRCWHWIMAGPLLVNPKFSTHTRRFAVTNFFWHDRCTCWVNICWFVLLTLITGCKSGLPWE